MHFINIFFSLTLCSLLGIFGFYCCQILLSYFFIVVIVVVVAIAIGGCVCVASVFSLASILYENCFVLLTDRCSTRETAPHTQRDSSPFKYCLFKYVCPCTQVHTSNSISILFSLHICWSVLLVSLNRRLRRTEREREKKRQESE